MTVYDTGVTSSGVAWTRYVEVVGNDSLYYTIADRAVSLPSRHGVIYAHGAGGNAEQFHQLSSWKPTLDTIIDSNAVVMEGYGCGAYTTTYQGSISWGREFARMAYVDMARVVESAIDIVDWTVIGRSMGGLVGKQLAAKTSEINVVAYLDVSGIYDLMAEYDSSPPPGHFNLPRHWGVADDDREGLLSITANNDPGRFSPSLYSGLHVFVIYGTNDTTAVPSISGLKFWNDLGGTSLGNKSKLITVTNGDHSQGNSGTYGRPEISSFLLDVWGLTPAVKPAEYLFRTLSKVRLDSTRKQLVIKNKRI